jgi:hypothetical protein
VWKTCWDLVAREFWKYSDDQGKYIEEFEYEDFIDNFDNS